MDWILVCVGICLVGLGFLVKAFPTLMSGYSIMPQEEKEKVDMEGLSTAFKYFFIIWGVLFGIVYNLLLWLGWGYIAEYLWYAFFISTVFCSFIFQIIYTIKKKKE